MRLPIVLTIAGSDSGGGAGVQADLKTFYALGAHGACALTSVTSQNTMEVIGRYDLPPEVVAAQLDAVLSDFEVAAAKTGMLGNVEIIRAVAKLLRGHGLNNLVIDPVVVSSTGQSLLGEGGIEALMEALLPLAAVLTPNMKEASALTGLEVNGLEGMREAAVLLKGMGPASVVITGGHLEGDEATDVFFDGERCCELPAPKVATENDHGTGCVFSAAVAARLALGEDVLQAVGGAKQDVLNALANSLDIGRGRGPVHPVREP